MVKAFKDHELNKTLASIRESAASISATLELEVLNSVPTLTILLNLFPFPLYVVDTNNSIVTANKAFLQLVGLTSRQYVERFTIEELFARQAIDAEVSSSGLEWKIYSAEGIPAFYELVVAPLVAHEGAIARRQLVVVQDVTIKRKNEFKALDLTAFQSNILLSFPLPVFYTDPNGSYIRGSNEFMELFDLTAKAAISKTIGDFLPTEFAFTFTKDNLSPATFNTKIKDREFKVTRTPIFDASDKHLGFVGVLVENEQLQVDSAS